MLSHTHRILSWFDLRHHQPPTPPPPAPLLDFPPGQITLIQGPSGAGKSFLLRQLLRRARRRRHQVLDLNHIPLPRRPVVDVMARAMNGSTDDEPTTLRALEALSRAGLGEVWTYLRTPHQLSEGQRWRLKLAIAIERLTNNGQWTIDNGPLLIADEFTSLLDRLTAHILSRSLRKSLNARPHLHALLATSHEDLTHALQPDRIIHCDFGHVEFRIPKPESRNKSQGPNVQNDQGHRLN